MSGYRVRWPLPVLSLLLALAACGGRGALPAASEDDRVDQAVSGEIVVLAASSLTEAFTELGVQFAEANPGASAVFSFAGSQTLATQLVQGAQADVFASANEQQMDVVAAAGLLDGAPVLFAANSLAIAVEAGNPFEVTALSDLANPQLTLVLAAPAVPAGRAAAAALAAAGVEVTPASLELDVRAALAKVVLGEADAAIVYASDLVTAPDGVQGVMLLGDQDVIVAYPVGVLASARTQPAAQAFVALLRSPAGQAVLAAHGFQAPPG